MNLWKFATLIYFLFLISGQLFAADNQTPRVPLYELGNRVHGWSGAESVSDEYLDVVQPILNRRCVACHGCYEAPCQLNLQSYGGLRRGFHEVPIFSTERKQSAIPFNTQLKKDLFADQDDEFTTVKKWRDLGYKPVIGNDEEDLDINRDSETSLFYQMLDMGQKSPDRFDPRPLKKLQDFKDDNSRYRCVASDQQYEVYFTGGLLQNISGKANPWGVMSVSDYASKYVDRNFKPIGGMPFGFTKIDAESHNQLVSWMRSGAKGPTQNEVLTKSARPTVIAEWEDFLNTDSAKGRHTARYIFEHTYLAHWSFDEIPGEFYEIIRVASSEGSQERPIVTDLPYETDGTPANQIKYRLRKVTYAISQKHHILWKLNHAKLRHLEELFHKQEWQGLKTDPVYGSNNLFENFEQIPAHIRSQFMMENAHVIAGAMVQGAVCVGSRATYAIQDHFWVWFLKPDSDPSVLYPKLGKKDWSIFNTAPDDGQGALSHFKQSRKDNQIYASAWESKLRELLKNSGRKGLSLDDLWDGGEINPGIGTDPYYAKDGNPNAWITILRHGKSATVHYGPEGRLTKGELKNGYSFIPPQSVWVLSYSNFERLYYDLVAHYKEYDTLTHKLATWRHMSYVRLEAEDLAISLLPEDSDIRTKTRAHFTRGFALTELYHSHFPMHSAGRGTEIQLAEQDQTHWLKAAESAMRQMARKLRRSTSGHNGELHDTAGFDSPNFSKLTELMRKSNHPSTQMFARFLPETAYLRIAKDKEPPEMYTIIVDSAYKAHNIVAFEDIAREPSRNRVSIFRGLVGAYPNIIFDIQSDQLDSFLDKISNLKSKVDYFMLQHAFAWKRTHPKFWEFYDELHLWKSFNAPGNDPREQGIIDLSEYEFF